MLVTVTDYVKGYGPPSPEIVILSKEEKVGNWGEITSLCYMGGQWDGGGITIH